MELPRRGMQQEGTPLIATPSADISQATVICGPLDVRFCDVFTIQAILAGSNATGTLQLQGCIGKPTGAPGSFAWPQVFSNISTPFAVTQPGNYLWEYDRTAISAVQVLWIKSGTSIGSLTVAANTKGLG